MEGEDGVVESGDWDRNFWYSEDGRQNSDAGAEKRCETGAYLVNRRSERNMKEA